MPRGRISAAVFVCLIASASLRAGAQIQPAGSEFRVNTYTTDVQAAPAVCRAAAGDTVVVWQSDNQDGRGWGIFGQRYDGSGHSAGAEFQVNTYVTGNQSHPAVACDPGGNFVVVWDGDQNARIRGVFGQRYDRAGQQIGEEFQVNTDTAADSMLPVVCSNAVGDLVVAWQGYQLTGKLDIFARRYANTGEPEGDQFQVNTYTTDTQARPAIACGAQGEVVLVWDSEGQDGSDFGVLGQRYDSNGTPQGFEFQVNTYTRGMQRHPRIATAADGEFVVVWQTRHDAGSGYAVAAQRFDRAGTALGSEFQVGSTSGGRQYRPVVATDAAGDFVVAWYGDGKDGSGDAVSGQRYDRHAIALGTEFPVNSYTTGNQRQPVVAADAVGDFVVVWQSSGQDGNDDGVFGQRFTVCGNGVLDPGEDCDDGNTLGGDCCAADCRFETVPSLWDTGRVCRAVAVEELLCPRFDHTNSTPCSDGNACTTNDFCFYGVCIGSERLDCDDQNGCTTDSCKPSAGCVHTANTAPCDDSNACTLNDTCRNGVCASGQPLDCDDGNPCTDDTCDPLTGCEHHPNSAACEDGNRCTAGDTCQRGICVGGPSPNCDDRNSCTSDSCDPMAGCLNLPNASPCDDADPCTTGDVCVAGSCVAGALAACDDSNACTDDSCAAAIGCMHTPNTSPCDDGNACTRLDTCLHGACTGAQPVVCTALDQCHTAGACDPATGQCSAPPRRDGASCDDGDLCTVDDRCLGGTCVGTAGTPFLVKDVRRGGSGSFPAELAGANGQLYFRANDGKHGRELWVSNGADDGTRLVADIQPGPAGASPSALTNVNGVIFFSAVDATHGRELWKSDGTAAGTSMVKDIHRSGSSNPSHLTAVNGTLFFVADDGSSGAELWRSDGTDSGTFLVKDIRPGGCGSGSCSSAPDHLTQSGGMLFFTASDGSHGIELWRSDGTEAGTIMVEDMQPGAGDSFPAFLTDLSGTLLFRAFNDRSGYELWRSDGTEAGTMLVKDLRPGRCGRLPCSASPSYLATAGERVFFGAPRERTELWKSDGTAAGTARVRTIPGLPDAHASLNGALLFRASGSPRGSELWRTDGTRGGTRPVLASHTNASLRNPAWLATVDGTLYFSASDTKAGTELWKSNGTPAGTMMVTDLYPGADGSSPNSSSPASLTEVNEMLFFSADDGKSGRELWALCGDGR